MMGKSLFLSFISLTILVLLSSCVNSDYDWDDIDTTSRVSVKDLVVPIRIDKIKLDQVLDVDSESQIKKVLDPSTGEYIYAVMESGSFESNSIDIPTFFSEKPETEKIEASIYLEKIKKDLDKRVTDSIKVIASKLGLPTYNAAVEAYKPLVKKAIWDAIPDTTYLARYPIGVHMSTFDTPKVRVHKAIRSIDNIDVACTLAMTVYFGNLDFIDNVRAKNLKIQLPKGLKATPSAGTYDSETGILDISNDGEGVLIQGGKYFFTVSLEGIDFNAPGSGAKFTTKENDKGEFYYSTLVKILSGDLEIYKNNFIGEKSFFDLPKQAKFICDPDMSAIEIKAFTGKIKYEVDGFDAKSISLSDIPNVMNGDETNIFLDNPQIYLSINNPLAGDGIFAEANVTLTPIKNGEERDVFTIDNGALCINKPMNSFCLSPSKPTKLQEGFDNAEWLKFSGLSRIISGNGLPDKISVDILNPGVPEQQVQDFVLGQNYAPIRGEYLFYAPLALDKYSLIVYEDTETGWDKDGYLSNLSVTKLKVSATVSSDLPLGATLTINALNSKGEVIPGVEFSTVRLEPNRTNQDFVFEQKSGVINKLDGVSIRASISSDGSKPLQPLQQLQLDNVRVTVSGYYQGEI